ncbi:hypothetical protein [Intestinibacter bartlettii]|uniref:hypothetical protein n=1 Tax=Intestinibacter bartlettii TaxID=261299 RepID=UPI003521C6B0
MLLDIIIIIIVIGLIGTIISAIISAIGSGVSIIYDNRKKVITSIIAIAIIWWILNNLEFTISHWYAFVGCIGAYFIFKKVKEIEKRMEIEREEKARIAAEEEKRRRDEQLKRKVLETVNKMGMADIGQVSDILGINQEQTAKYLKDLILTRDLKVQDFGGGKKLYMTHKKINGETIYETEEINLD